MDYQTHNDGLSLTVANGTSRQGFIHATYDQLVQKFGQPHDGDRYKVDAEWLVKFDSGAVATIYNWKNGRNYRGEYGEPVEGMTFWNVGGYDFRAVSHLQQVLALDNVSAA